MIITIISLIIQLKKKLPHCCYCEKFQCLTQKKLDEHIKECHKFHCFKCKKVFTNKVGTKANNC